MPIKLFVLIHSPLVGPYTWALTSTELQERGCRAAAPVLESRPIEGGAFWERHVENIAASLAGVFGQDPVILVAHSGAGPLLPAVSLGIEQPVEGYLFVDALLPEPGKSRLDLFEGQTAADQFRRKAKGGLLPVWSAEDLRAAIPDEQKRSRFVAELSPLPLAVYEEQLPVFDGWPDAPCGYLQFGSNPAYEPAVQRALLEGFAHIRLEGRHFHMLVDPGAVAAALLDLTRKMDL